MNTKNKKFTEFLTTSLLIDTTTLGSVGANTAIWEKYFPFSSEQRELKKGDYLLHIGEILQGVYFVKKGKIRSNLLGPDGAVKIFAITCEGCVFGEQLIFHDQPSLFEAVVLEDTEVYFFDKRTMFEIIKKDFEINMFIMRSIAVRSRNLACQLEDVSLRSIAQSICRILYALCCHQAQVNKTIENLSIKISHQDLANMLGIHRVSVTNNLNILKKQGVLDYK
ncbi:MAG: Crp/Fnr family transcriptional regulator [Peptococcales bacterium]|jgi:CRP/FNR family cyclic AMP-dependent transcriptional regulator